MIDRQVSVVALKVNLRC